MEIKARAENPVRLRAAALDAGARPHRRISQVDTFYRVPRGRLKLRVPSSGKAELIGYARPDEMGPKLSAYHRLPTESPGKLHDLLARALGIRGVVEKRREVLLLGRTRIHLDEVRGLGSFLEIEVVLDDRSSPEEGEAIARDLLGRLGVPLEALVSGAYIDLLERDG